MAHLASDRRRSTAELAYPRLSSRLRLRWPVAVEWLPLAISLAVLLTWEAGVRGGRIVPLLFPAPSSILATTLGALASGSLLGDLGATLMRVVLGVLLGSVAGILVGLAMGWWRPLRAALDPFVAGAYAVPKIAVLPLFLVFFGVGELPKVIIATLSAFFPVLISTMDGVRQIPPEYFQVAENYGADRLRVVTRVLLPGSLPYVLTGVRLGLNATLLLTVAAEMVTGQTGLGAVIWRAWETMRTEQLYASLLIIVTLGVGANGALQALARTVMPWQPEQHR